MTDANMQGFHMARRLVVALGLVATGLLLAGGYRVSAADDPAKPADVKKLVAAGSGSVSEQVRVINEEIAKMWKEQNLTPSVKTSDYSFIRRASLDIIGRIATPEEIDRFMKDPQATRRTQLIDRLLDSEDYARHWATMWTVWLMTRSANAEYREQMHLWLEEQLSRNKCRWDKVVTDLLTATGKTSENGAVNFILTHLGEPTAQGHVVEEGQFNMYPVTSRTTRLFLGLQTQCTQCHDHPFKTQWKQKHFYGVNAFFRQVERKGTPAMQRGMMAKAPDLTLVDNPEWNVDEDRSQPGVIYFERRNGTLFTARPMFLLDEKTKNTAPPNGKRREALADYIVKSDQFAKAYINRMFAHFFGHGMNTPGAFDDFGEDNQITHPALMDYLVKELKAYEYNPRELIRWICNSEAYGLSSVANKTNEKTEAEPYFSRMLLKSISPEQLFESLMVATQAEAAETKEAKKKLREKWLSKLIVNFGDDEGNEVTFSGTVVQALILMNGQEINEAISNRKKGPVAAALNSRTRSISNTMNTLYLAVLNRPPTPAEMTEIPKRLRGRDKDPWAPWQDLEWALINSNEFFLNH
jgi:hypothetical protein